MSDEENAGSGVDQGSSDTVPSAPRGGGRVLRLLRWLGVGVLCLLLVASTLGAIATIFVRDQLLTTDNFVDRAAHLAADSAVQEEVTDRVMAEIDAALDVDTMSNRAQDWIDEEDVPEDVEAVIEPAASGLHEYLESEVREFVGSRDFVEAWNAAVRAAHSELMRILDREQGEVLSNAGTAVSVELGPIVALVKAELLKSGFEPAAEIPEVDTQIQLADTDLVPAAQDYTDLLRLAAAWLPWIGLASLVLLVLVAPRRPRAAAIATAVVGVTAVSVALALGTMRDRYVADIDAPVVSAATRVLTAGFIPQYVVTGVLALLVAVSCAVLGWLWCRRTDPAPQP